MTIRVLLADDQAIVRTGMAMILAAEDGIEVVAQAADGVAAIQQTDRHRPDVVLMDIRMPRLNGIEALRHLHRPGAAHTPKVVMVTTFDDDEYVHQALHNGACGFLLKDAGPRLLAEAVRSAASGEALISPSITVRLLQQFARPAATAAPARPSPLTRREAEVAVLVSRGHTNTEIAAALHISAGTVKTHLTNIQSRLGVRNRVEIAAWVWESGLAR
ncbi:response regulator transcription factor [Streptomyces sp. DH37]|uniref:response regulator transcription factor n=1 Tax=Streptomyces sp. DH37 TaxID=3040122 RepID=UPI002442FCDC|nr:response regulator transcription factor [Streptomyces sp. DH37]MDG9702913.1 response regulator transcription factor [Streptomyces sp. DH37]